MDGSFTFCGVMINVNFCFVLKGDAQFAMISNVFFLKYQNLVVDQLIDINSCT